MRCTFKKKFERKLNQNLKNILRHEFSRQFKYTVSKTNIKNKARRDTSFRDKPKL